ncbi:hypothetical protein ACFX11_038400 [Malus domestica]
MGVPEIEEIRSGFRCISCRGCRVEVDQERGIGVAKELEEGPDDSVDNRFLELGIGRRERHANDVDDGEGGGDGVGLEGG